MGFFSYECKACGHPALCRQAVDPEINEWMSECIILFKNGDRISGEYDGYGRVGIYSQADSSDGLTPPCLYHVACWEKARKPKYSGPSKDADDQGWFFDDGAHDMLDPRKKWSKHHLPNAQAQRDGRKRGQQFRAKDEDADEGTYEAIFAEHKALARKMSPAARVKRWGYDLLRWEGEDGASL